MQCKTKCLHIAFKVLFFVAYLIVKYLWEPIYAQNPYPVTVFKLFYGIYTNIPVSLCVMLENQQTPGVTRNT